MRPTSQRRWALFLGEAEASARPPLTAPPAPAPHNPIRQPPPRHCAPHSPQAELFDTRRGSNVHHTAPAAAPGSNAAGLPRRAPCGQAPPAPPPLAAGRRRSALKYPLTPSPTTNKYIPPRTSASAGFRYWAFITATRMIKPIPARGRFTPTAHQEEVGRAPTQR